MQHGRTAQQFRVREEFVRNGRPATCSVQVGGGRGWGCCAAGGGWRVRAMLYGPDGSVLPAMIRLQRKEELCWAVIKFVPSPMELAPDGVVWNSPGRCYSVESFGEKKDGGIADWSRFMANFPDDECRLGIFRFDFRAVRKFVLVSWSPPSARAGHWDDTKIWDIRKQVKPPGKSVVVVFLLMGSLY